ncbi:methylamine dehydrogenase (amicyanin) light chain [Erythrobacteraceae bacterium E2-1 Yellow Sea]|nr:methylamine dehydrogenase (amicyanin) light chain [Erythrobacteraceae bacterium E2-1 Yellow Sea]
MTSRLDKWIEKSGRNIAKRTSRRGIFAILGGGLVGAAAIPLLPIARAASGGDSSGVAPQSTGKLNDPGDPTSCDYWRYCGIDGFLCACCGGTTSSCPPGTEMSPITWIGTCNNPADGRSYVISYNDCCGTTACGRCLCNRNEDDKPMVRPQANNDINWCLGSTSEAYNCSTAIIVGLAQEDTVG